KGSKMAVQEAAAATTTEGQAEAQPAAPLGAAAGEQPAQSAPAQQQQTAKPITVGDATPTVSEQPESYEFKAPEGRTFDAEVLKAYSEVARELKLPQESAQKVLDKVAPVL